MMVFEALTSLIRLLTKNVRRMVRLQAKIAIEKKRNTTDQLFFLHVLKQENS